MTIDQFRAYVVKNGENLSNDENWDLEFFVRKEFQKVFESLLHYFLGLETCQDFGLNPRKGILLRGPYGIGKTVLLKAFEKNPFQCFEVCPVTDMVDAFNMTKQENTGIIMGKFSGYLSLPAHIGSGEYTDNGYFGHKQKAICYDDLGSESMGNKFQKVNVIQKLFLSMYNNRTYKPFNHIYAITNANDSQLVEAYEHRVADRLTEMLNFIDLPEIISLRGISFKQDETN